MLTKQNLNTIIRYVVRVFNKNMLQNQNKRDGENGIHITETD